ncbi:MAG TPA: aspartate kinase [Polyangiaceae bacterium]|jgi:aspartate kinase
MPIVVQKYGGSSVADVDKLAQVAELVARTRRAGNDVVVVVSAMGKTTEGLLALARQTSNSADAEPPRRELDMLVSTGERVTMALLSIALHARGCDAISFTGSQSGIITNDRHFDARIIEVRPHRIEDELARGRVVIVAGYQGMSYKREITTLGRGGSDTTAVALTAALGADRCEIYSDVDGVYSADPHRVADARHLPELDYAVMQEAAEAGAKVLNARAVEWAAKHGVVIHARKTADFARGEGRETLVRRAEQDGEEFAIVVDGKIAWLAAPRHRASDLLAALELAQLPVRSARADRECELVLSLTSVPDFSAHRPALTEAGAHALRESVTAVSVVGVGVSADLPRLSHAFAALPRDTLTSELSPLRLSAIVPTVDAQQLELAWHALFVPGLSAAV